MAKHILSVSAFSAAAAAGVGAIVLPWPMAAAAALALWAIYSAIHAARDADLVDAIRYRSDARNTGGDVSHAARINGGVYLEARR